jgi:hypothetical protein
MGWHGRLIMQFRLSLVESGSPYALKRVAGWLQPFRENICTSLTGVNIGDAIPLSGGIEGVSTPNCPKYKQRRPLSGYCNLKSAKRCWKARETSVAGEARLLCALAQSDRDSLSD